MPSCEPAPPSSDARTNGLSYGATNGQTGLENPDIYRTDSVAREIATRRANVHGKAQSYQRLGCEVASDEPKFDLPLIAAALAGAGSLFYGANLDVVGGIGLAAGGITAAKAYAHPDTTLVAYLKAEKEFMCVLDETDVLTFVDKVDVLYTDRDALSSAVTRLSEVAGPLLPPNEPTTAEGKAFAKAAQSALDGAEKTRKAIDEALANYMQLPASIDKAAGKIDFAARNSTLRSVTYAGAADSIKTALNASLENKVTVKEARTSLLTAANSAGTANALANAADEANKAKAQKPQMPTAESSSIASLRSAQTTVPLALPYSSFAEVQTNAADGITRRYSLEHIAPRTTNSRVLDMLRGSEEPFEAQHLMDQPLSRASSQTQSVDLISRIVRASQIATEDLPTPSFADVRADVALCIPAE
jgi:hypothetical protein